MKSLKNDITEKQKKKRRREREKVKNAVPVDVTRF